MQKNIAAGLFLLSLVLLIPGLVYPMITIKANVEKSDIMDLGVRSLIGPTDPSSLMGSVIKAFLQSVPVDGTLEIYNKTRSVLGTIHDLMTSGYPVVALLIGLFAVVVPFIKSLLMLGAALGSDPARAGRLKRASQRISQWSMVDVFVIAIIVSYLALNASAGSGGTMTLNAQFGSGFYCFAAYCILSNLSAQLTNSSLRNPSGGAI